MLLGATDADCGALSVLGEHAVIETATAAANARARIDLFFMFVFGQLHTVPPPTTECLKQCRCIGKTIGLRLDQVNPPLLVGLLRAQQRKIARVAALPLSLRQIQCDLARIGCLCRSLDGLCVLLERRQGVGYILKGGQYGAAILLGCLIVSGFCSTLMMQERAALKNRCS